jgi:hypothetical protein
VQTLERLEKFVGEDKKFILNVSKETLKSAPGFNRNKWPEVADFSWLAKDVPVPLNVTTTGNVNPK